MAEITCKCEKTFDADIPEKVNLSANPDLREKILKGEFLTFTCPYCGTTIKPDVPLSVQDEPKGIDIYLVPEIERNRYLLGLNEYEEHDRIVIGYRELVEKLKITDYGLDDRVIEMIKYYLLIKAGTDNDPVIVFAAAEQDNLLFEIFGLKTDEIAQARIPKSLYQKMEQDLAVKQGEEPFKMILNPPYVSICKVEIEEG
jgi:hypothetical protein